MKTRKSKEIEKSGQHRDWRKIGKIFWVMFRIGMFTFGGGLVMIPQMSREFVDKYHWIEREEIVDFFAVAQSLPGVVAINASIMVGYRVAGVVGGLAAAFGAILPSFLALIVVTIFYQRLIDNRYMIGAMRGIRAAVAALLFHTVLKMRRGVLGVWFARIIFVLAAAVCLFTEVNVAFVLLGGALAGVVYTLIKRKGCAG